MFVRTIFPALLLLLLFCGKLHAQSGKIIARITIEGNRKTKDEIILRELTFKSGDSLSDAQTKSRIERSRSNLVNTLLFNYVDIVSVPIDSEFTDIFIHIKERFYLYPIPVFQFADPNFNTWWINKDFSRTNYGLVILKRNFRGRNEDIGAKAQFGYSKEFAFMYRLPYITKKQNIGAGVWMSYVQNNEITVGTDNNKRIFYVGNTGNTRDELSFRLNTTLRRKLYATHFLEFRYNRARLFGNFTTISQEYFKENRQQMNYFSLFYTFKHDHRDNKGYPLKGSYTQIDVAKIGLWKIDGLNPAVFYSVITNNQFFQLSKKLYYAMQFKAKINLSKSLPYFFQEGLGYTNFIRGYEYYVIDGQHFGLFKSNVKFELFKPKVKDIKILENTNFGKFHYAFYLNMYIDAGYVVDKKYFNRNPLNNQLLYGGGLGLDFVTFYDKVIRFEYSLNKELEHGFFLHFIKPI